MSKSNGFLQLRRGVWEHVRDGRMSVTETLAFIYICCEADTRTGIWKGSAKSLSGELGIPERTARDVLEKMEHGDYIRRFAVPGRHSCYPILVHKFLITDGEHNGEQLNAIESKSPADLAYFSREQSVEDGVERGVEHGAAQKRKRIEKETEKHPAPPVPSAAVIPTSASLDQQTRDAAFEVFWEEWPRKQAKGAARKAWQKIPIAEYLAVMAGLEKWRKSDQWTRGVIPHPATWLNEKRWQDEDVPESGKKGGIDADQRTRDNLRAAGLVN